MNKIEQELGKLITQSRKDIPVIEDCYSLLEKHCIGFAEWLGDKRFNRNTWFDETNHCMDMVTTQELFKLYIEQL